MMKIQLLLVACLGVVLVSACPFGSQEGHRLIKTSEHGPAQLMSQDEIWALIEAHKNFVDVTDHQFPDIKASDVYTKAIPTSLRFQSTVAGFLPRIEVPRMQTFIQQFSSYHNRYYQSITGQESQAWLLAQVRSSIVGYAGATVEEITHAWSQKSIVARIQGSDPSLRSERVILGAHQDSINTMGSSLNAPGADDNASGSVTVLETLRVFAAGGFKPKRTIEFHWYAAEEVGLRGSADIAKAYSNEGVTVAAMVNLDVPGYFDANNPYIGIYTDNVNAQLTAFLRVLVDGYCDMPWRNRVCGYGCSDHASFNSYGFPAAFPAEYTFHPRMHSPNDNYASVGFSQVKEFVKLAVGFMVEVAEPSA